MRLLVIGGTRFLGRHLVQSAVERGHDVTLFNRGKTDPRLFAELEQVFGDRDGELKALEGRQWDACIDTCGYLPRVVAASVALLSSAVRHYTFISTLSVYEDFTAPDVNESSPLASIDDPAEEEITAETYGPLKALCEKVVQEAMPQKAFLPRPGLIVGPHDPSDRFTYWPHRLDRGGEVLAPGRPERQVQFIDVRDLSSWIIGMVENEAVGPYNATGPLWPLTMAQFLEAVRLIVGRGGSYTWVDEEFLTEHEVAPYSDMPLWIPCEDDRVDTTKAAAHGLILRPTDVTIRDTLDWSRSHHTGNALRSGLSPEREAELLRLWHASR